MFFDHVTIEVRSGKGGDGAVTFRREKYVPDGGPDGGDGGRGGHVIVRATSRKTSLIDFRFKHLFRAGNGENGQNRKKNGKQGEDLILELPLGTQIYDDETGRMIADLKEDGEELTLLYGGKGGLGNEHFKNSVRQAPNFGRAGGPPESLVLRLELRLIADVGLVGMPNAGKSSLLAACSNARPKIGDYAFTTLEPQLGVVSYDHESFLMADLPGLIEGASDGAGLGHDFLRHTARCRILLHVLDAAPAEGSKTPLEAYRQIRHELSQYDASLARRKEIILWNKADLLDESGRQKLREDFRMAGLCGRFVSAATHEGLQDLCHELFGMLAEPFEEEEAELPDPDWRLYRFQEEEPFHIEKRGGVAHVTGGWIEGLVRSINFHDVESFYYFQTEIRKKGLNDALEAAGVREGDWVEIDGAEFQYAPSKRDAESSRKGGATE